MPEVILPCPRCKSTDLGVWNFVVCKDCEMRGPRDVAESAAIAAWNALPRMSTIIAWQLQAAGAALALQKLIESGQAMRNAQELFDLSFDYEGPARQMEELFDAALDEARNALEARNG